MSRKSPAEADFPSEVKVSIVPPPQGKSPANVLILLHGLGDGLESFAKLGQNLNLPETVCVAVRAPMPLPFELGGSHWADDLLFDQITAEMDFDGGFERSNKCLVDKVIQQVLVENCGFSYREIFLFGFGQGGMAALAAAAKLNSKELGAVISVGGPLPATTKNSISNSPKIKTPILMCHGKTMTLVTASKISEIKNAFGEVQDICWNRPGDGMPTNREEMLPIMQVLARRLKSKAGVPSGAQEIQ